HHLLKHRGGWTVHRDTTGNTVWTSPTGHTYIKPPERIGPAKQEPPDQPDRPDSLGLGANVV
ncbi:hypothetical protein, partial [Jiangella asiatica]|uniref:hypothetical protein n=1 Tax=Jiangella asiatica TaxID=2530372 RepID=UPI00193E00C4